MEAAAILKITKRHLRNGLTHLHEIWYDDATALVVKNLAIKRQI